MRSTISLVVRVGLDGDFCQVYHSWGMFKRRGAMREESEARTLFVLQRFQHGSRMEATGLKVHHGVVSSKAEG